MQKIQKTLALERCESKRRGKMKIQSENYCKSRLSFFCSMTSRETANIYAAVVPKTQLESKLVKLPIMLKSM